MLRPQLRCAKDSISIFAKKEAVIFQPQQKEHLNTWSISWMIRSRSCIPQKRSKIHCLRWIPRPFRHHIHLNVGWPAYQAWTSYAAKVWPFDKTLKVHPWGGPAIDLALDLEGISTKNGTLAESKYLSCNSLSIMIHNYDPSGSMIHHFWLFKLSKPFWEDMRFQNRTEIHLLGELSRRHCLDPSFYWSKSSGSAPPGSPANQRLSHLKLALWKRRNVDSHHQLLGFPAVTAVK